MSELTEHWLEFVPFVAAVLYAWYYDNKDYGDRNPDGTRPKVEWRTLWLLLILPAVALFHDLTNLAEAALRNALQGALGWLWALLPSL